RIKLMEAHALVSRRFYSEHPPRAEYELTAKGKELGMVVGALAAWGARHVYKRARLVHADSGQDVRLGYFRADTGRRVPGGTVRVTRGRTGIRRRRG
ncbi:MAG TPA: winged helix-turn-helix transcriptional regulator, partial [Methylomirabilota bacterium]|nr:winged helix-turn-helix transcriptional regulator [Methylomirabilota bacterium]